MLEDELPTVYLATMAVREVMGQQSYEIALLSGAQGLYPGLKLRQRVVASWRSELPREVRLPLSALEGRPWLADLAGSWAYRDADLVHRCDLRLPPAGRRQREVLTIHDLAFEFFNDEGRVSPQARIAALRSRIVIAPSEYSAAQLRERWALPDVRAVQNGFDPAFSDRQPLTQADRLDLGAPGRFVVHSGGSTTRKNLVGLAAAWTRVAAEVADVQLLLTGPRDDRRTALFAGLPRARLLGRIPRALQVRAVQNADAVVVPSTYEGFGLPALEAMAAGTPVVAADRASLPEVCGTAALLVQPDGEALAAGLLRVLTDDAVRDRLQDAGPKQAANFSWERSCRAHVDIYREALA